MLYKTCLLFDPANDWLAFYFSNKVFEGLKGRFDFVVSHDPEEITGFDIVFLLGFTRVLDSDFMDRNSLCLVVHESDLPQGRGFSPVQWQILEGKNEIPVRLIEAGVQVDTGDIYGRDRIKLNGSELFKDIRHAQGEATVRIVRRFLEAYPEVSGIPQKGEATTYSRRTDVDNEIDVDKTLRDQFNLLRIGNNEDWPSHFTLGGHRYIIKIFKDDRHSRFGETKGQPNTANRSQS